MYPNLSVVLPIHSSQNQRRTGLNDSDNDTACIPVDQERGEREAKEEEFELKYSEYEKK